MYLVPCAASQKKDPISTEVLCTAISSSHKSQAATDKELNVSTILEKMGITSEKLQNKTQQARLLEVSSARDEAAIHASAAYCVQWCLPNGIVRCRSQRLVVGGQTCFPKIFISNGDRTGGTADMSCPHRVQLGLKLLLLEESPQVCAVALHTLARSLRMLRMLWFTQMLWFTHACLCALCYFWDPDVSQDLVQLLCMLRHLPNTAFYDAWCHATSSLYSTLAKVG